MNRHTAIATIVASAALLACPAAEPTAEAGGRFVTADAGPSAERDGGADVLDAGRTDTGSRPDAGSPSDTGPAADAGSPTPSEGSWRFGEETVRVEITATDGRRSYRISTSQAQRDDGPNQREFSEQAGDPILRSGVLLTDALFTMAVHEARLNAVSEVQDAAFGAPQACECYQTGELWNWVWTRDIAYAVELGLAWLDPQRAANSLLFKLSERKSGGGLQIVQDTGTGGSWPVSTDRVTWARGAMAVLRVHDHPELRAAAIAAMRETVAVDRRYAFDARDGLYRGETSFLDWREQSYPAWTASKVVHIGMSKSLSTNLNHLFMLRALEELTGEDHGSAALAAAIDRRFWDGQVYRSATNSELDPSTTGQQDLLATSLAVLDLGTHPEALAAYPHGPHGPPVIFPQQQQIPIYHNRAIWPFVTAYSVLAARRADNDAVLSAGLDSLVRGAALNVSHMENLELMSGLPRLEDGAFSGPVVNSRRQLWSVAGFLGAVAHGVFGLRGENGQLRTEPRLPTSPWFLPGATLTVGGLTAMSPEARSSGGRITHIVHGDWKQLYGARSPSVQLSGTGDRVTLTFSGEEGATFDVYRDGELAAENARSPWSDTSTETACYTVVANLVWASQPSEPACWWGDNHQRIRSVTAEAFTAVGGHFSNEHGRGHYGNWGAPDHRLEFTIRPNHSGEHLLQAVYGNGAAPIATGITAAVKWLRVTNAGGELVAEGPLVMPQRSAWNDWGDSNFVPANLQAGQSYTVTISDGFNMSHLAHYRAYVGGRGGGESPSNDVNIAEVKLLSMRQSGGPP